MLPFVSVPIHGTPCELQIVLTEASWNGETHESWPRNMNPCIAIKKMWTPFLSLTGRHSAWTHGLKCLASPCKSTATLLQPTSREQLEYPPQAYFLRQNLEINVCKNHDPGRKERNLYSYLGSRGYFLTKELLAVTHFLSQLKCHPT